MSTIDEPVRIFVFYTSQPGATFDRNYYVDRHLPIVMKAWKQYGLISAQAFFPSENASGTLAMCECLFRDEAAVEAAFSSKETPDVMADVARFTNLTPGRLRAFPLKEA